MKWMLANHNLSGYHSICSIVRMLFYKWTLVDHSLNQLLYSAIIHRGKILANLVNSLPFANILPTKTYLPLSVNPNLPNISSPILGDKPICKYFPPPHNCAIYMYSIVQIRRFYVVLEILGMLHNRLELHPQ